MTFGQAYLGADNAPDKIRKAGLHSILKNLGWRLNDIGDLKFQPPTDRDPGMYVYGVACGVGAHNRLVGQRSAFLCIWHVWVLS